MSETPSNQTSIEIPGWYVELQAATLRQLPRPGSGPGQIDQTTAQGWTKNQAGLKTNLAQCLLPPSNQNASSSKISTKEKVALENIAGCLRLISGAEILTLDPTDGQETMAEAGELFNAGLDGDFKMWKTNVKGSPTQSQKIVIHEQIKDGRFEQIYGGIGDNLDRMCLSQAQIIQFFKRKTYKNYLIHEKPGDAGYGWFRFLFKVGDEFFVADVFVSSGGGLGANVRRFANSFVWIAESRGRFVVPQLETVEA